MGALPRLGAGDGSLQLPRLGQGQKPVQQQAPPPTPLPFLGGMQTSRQSRAQQLLDLVKQGRVKPERANQAIKSLLYPNERDQLARHLAQDMLNGNDHRQEIKALGPSTLAAPPGHGVLGVLGNVASDINSTVTGMPAGIGLAGKAIGEDIKDLPGNLIRGRGAQDFRHTRKDILAPMAKNYEQTYGPLAHGNLGEFAHRVGQHPLGPILDAASVVSAGLGTAARSGEALTALRAGRLSETAGGLTKVGDRFTVQPMKNGMFAVREGNQYVPELSNLPSKDAAVAAAKKLQTYGARPITAFAKGGGARGRLLERYQEATGVDHSAEEAKTVKDVVGVLDDPHLQLDRRSLKDVVTSVGRDLKTTAASDVGKAGKMHTDTPQYYGKGFSKALTAGGVALREASDLVRAGAIYLRPAYLPNNWVGNSFMSAAHQGVLAPVNLAKSMLVDKYIGKRYTAAMDKAMGDTPIQALSAGKGAPKGYVGSVTSPLAGLMGKAADTPFRRAAFLHEARRMGYSKLSDVRGLFDKAAAGDDQALSHIGTMSRKAQEEIVKFGDMNPTERATIKKLIFVYSWVRGASRYAGRFPMQHPMQAMAYNHLANQVGNPYLQRELGGVPSFMQGTVPVGHDKNGNPLIINPFSLNPLGTAVQMGRAAAGVVKAAKGGGNFNRYRDTDIFSTVNPLLGNYLTAREGGKGMAESLQQTLAPVRLAHDLQHPGTGSIYPTSRTEALGHFTVGAMYPREADQVALTKSLEREQVNNPSARIPTDMALIKKASGIDVPKNLVTAYKHDLAEISREKDFQTHYAQQHGQSGFRNLPPANRVDAALNYLAKGHASPQDIEQYRQLASQVKTDADLNSLANQLWSLTGTGQYKQLWDHLLSDARGQRLTRQRQ
jgi:hypothetical protein